MKPFAALRAIPTLLKIGFLEAVAYRAEMLVWVFATTMPLRSCEMGPDTTAHALAQALSPHHPTSGGFQRLSAEKRRQRGP